MQVPVWHLVFGVVNVGLIGFVIGLYTGFHLSGWHR